MVLDRDIPGFREELSAYKPLESKDEESKSQDPIGP